MLHDCGVADVEEEAELVFFSASLQLNIFPRFPTISLITYNRNLGVVKHETGRLRPASLKQHGEEEKKMRKGRGAWLHYAPA